MLVDTKIKLSKDESLYVGNAGDNIKAVKLRIKKITGLYAKNIFEYVEDNLDDDRLITCAFCGRLKSFNYMFEIHENSLFLNIKYKNNIKICSRTNVNCRSKEINPNSIEFVKIAYGFDNEDMAHQYLLKRNKSPFYKHNHSTEEDYKNYQRRDENFYGKEKFNEIKRKISENSKKDVLIKKHGASLVKIMMAKKDSSSKMFFKEKFGDDWEEKYDKKNKKTKHNLETFINKYGVFLGEKKYYEYSKLKRVSQIEYCKGLTLNERKEKYDSMSKKYFKKKYGNDWENKFIKRVTSINSITKASKESLKFFELLIDKIKGLCIDYRIGVGKNKEWFIYDSNIKKISFYDFFIKNLGIIIEFHGSLWHFNPTNLIKDRPFGLVTEKLKKQDEYKKKLAIKSGYDYFVVFDTDNYKVKANELSKYIKEEYEKRNV